MKVQGWQWDTTGSLPFQVDLQAFYINGKYATRPVTYQRGAVYVDVIGDAPAAARWLDIENEDATPEMAFDWLSKRTLAVGRGGIYCNRESLPAVLSNIGTRIDADLWLATLDGNVYPYEANTLPPNVHLVAVQAFSSAYTKMNADLSVIYGEQYWKENALA
jgi:hypothetical protein